ncbi:MAG: glycoside hydrolase family 5 protein [Treponema sp.]|nr:glycoside hydrolase family 5 protein [Treponema sp.]
MKFFKLGVIIALVATIGLSMAACGSSNNGGNGTAVGPFDPIDPAPDGPAEPEAMQDKTALEFLAGARAGWNLGNTLDAVNSSHSLATETAWGNPAATQELFNGVKESGFDMVRITCTWIGHIGPGPDYKVSEARLRRVAEVVGYAKDAGFKAVVINIHHDGNYTSPPTWGFVDFAGAVNNSTKRNAIQNQLSRVWTQIAEYFINYGDYLIFETLNEVHSGNWGSNAPINEQNLLFDWNQAALSAIRATGGNNATRYVAVPGLGSTEPGTVIAAHKRNKLLPNDGDNGTDKLIVSVHFYDPWQYTVAEATGQGGNSLRHTWGSTAEKNRLNHEIGSLKTTFIDNGIAVYIGEWGGPTNLRSSMSTEIKNTHLSYIGSVAAAARANGIVPILWDDGGNFKCLERTNGKPKTGLWADVLSTIMNAINNP